MRHRPASLRAPAGAALALLLATACGGGADKGHDSAAVADSAANAAAAATGATPASDEIDIEDPKLGRSLRPDSTVADATDDFKPAGSDLFSILQEICREIRKTPMPARATR